MYQAVQTENLRIARAYSDQAHNNSANSNNDHELTDHKPISKDLEVCWLPSLPLTQKHKAPPISGLGILYSEELERVLQVFETDNLKEGIKMFSRDQAAALNIDPGCRIHWLEIPNPAHRARARLDLLTQIRT